MIVRKTALEEARRVNELFAICFEMPYTNCPADPEKDDATHWAAFDEDGEMMSTFTVSDFTVQFDGSPCKMGGIGGVATLPQYRRRGGIRACFREALPDMYGSGYDFSYLYPFSTAYYRKFGYENCVQKYGWTVDLSLLNPPKEGGSFRLAEKGCPMTAEIRALDAIWESHYNMMVLHGDEDYDWTRKCDPAVKQDFTYVCFDAAGKPNAYTTFRLANEPDGRNLVCSRFCFADKGGFDELMRLFKSLSSDHRFVKFSTPANPAMQYFMPEWSLGAVSWSVQSAGMVRVVNVKSGQRGAGRRGRRSDDRPHLLGADRGRLGLCGSPWGTSGTGSQTGESLPESGIFPQAPDDCRLFLILYNLPNGFGSGGSICGGNAMEIRQLDKEVYAGKKFTAQYQTNGYYDIRATGQGFEIKYTPFEAPTEKGFDDVFFGEWLEDPVAFGAFEDGKLAGFVEGAPESWNNRFRISNICVFDNAQRSKGVGTALMNTILKAAEATGARMIVLETQTCNESAVAFYKKNGFDIIGFDLYSYSNTDPENHEVRIEMGKKL